jgi:nitrite reductase/ring-hydroxylating ferredoxin subunit
MRVTIARVGEVAPGQSRKFLLVCDGREVEGFLVNHAGTYHAWVNECRHVAMGLDWVENQFFTADGAHLQCATHGAYYLPDTGECIAGPPYGKHLIRIPLTIEGGVIVGTCPRALAGD